MGCWVVGVVGVVQIPQMDCEAIRAACRTLDQRTQTRPTHAPTHDLSLQPQPTCRYSSM